MTWWVGIGESDRMGTPGIAGAVYIYRRDGTFPDRVTALPFPCLLPPLIQTCLPNYYADLDDDDDIPVLRNQTPGNWTENQA